MGKMKQAKMDAEDAIHQVEDAASFLEQLTLQLEWIQDNALGLDGGCTYLDEVRRTGRALKEVAVCLRRLAGGGVL